MFINLLITIQLFLRISKSSKKLSDELAENTAACPDVVPPNNVCDSTSLESTVIKDGQSPDSAKCSKNYRNCVVALKRSWSLKERGEIEVSLTDLNYQDELTRIPLSPTTIVHQAQWFEEDNKPSSKNTVLIADDHGEGGTTHRSIQMIMVKEEQRTEVNSKSIHESLTNAAKFFPKLGTILATVCGN
ncbi:uncharacterized protein CEXT_562321 [Caerostris extrusa]|uniref:Uncharacterized protein n=1 Tax=Caerostris extrusa TaxID=172846 RepID=A0AAV4PWW6_CAEEX|nr:uncharacterized protein CEXT_562321 [Caerostris extrusa]